jgi:thiaminase/transcriptional activator TenA
MDASYGSFVLNAWCEADRDGWDRYVNHAFVRGLGDGSLPSAAFEHYLIQDYVFLVHFSRAWALAVVKSATLEEMKLAAATVDGLVNHEMQLHVSTCAALGISEQQLFNATEEPENLAYTRYVMDAGLSGDYLDLLAALSPCVFGYGQIGATLKTGSPSGNPYQNWIDTYAGDEYQQICRDVGSVLDTATTDRLGAKPVTNPRWSLVTQRFTTATALEVSFWDMGLRARG